MEKRGTSRKHLSTNRIHTKNSFKYRINTDPNDSFGTDIGIPSAFKINYTKTTDRTHKVQKQTRLNILSTTKFVNRKIGELSFLSLDQPTLQRIKIIEEQFLQSFKSGLLNKDLNAISHLTFLFKFSQYINENLYNYMLVQKSIKELNALSKELCSPSLTFFALYISAIILFQYNSFSLSIFYFDKALKELWKAKNYHFYKSLQLGIYKTMAKLFLQTRSLEDSRDMAFMLLRKSWFYHNVDEEMVAYDLLGQIELEEGNVGMSRYFHLRMCQGYHEKYNIVLMSNNELEKNQKQPLELTIYQDIMLFLRKEKSIVSILRNYYRSEAEDQFEDVSASKKNQFLYTHRSPNRILRNHRGINRKLIDEKTSDQLHFIRPKDIKKMRKVITDYSSFLFELRRQWENDYPLRKMNQKDENGLKTL